MSGRPLRSLLLGVLLASLSATAVADRQPQAVRDLHYGEVLFHFYQEDYFTAITHLMAARQQQFLDHHRRESELLLGGLQLSYGMPNEAERNFRKLLTAEPNIPLRNRVWYYLTRIYQQRGQHQKAYATVEEIDTTGDAEMAAELAVLNANIRMELGRNSEAAEALKNIRVPEGWEEYLNINRGIALLRAGEIDDGRAVLTELGKQRAGSDELRALRDRANLGLGYELLRSGDNEGALETLNRIRLRGPFMQAALLGAGWASAAQEDYREALTPWLTLVKLASFDPAVQEAHLAVPYAFNQIGDQARAIFHYEAAISYYDREQQEMAVARDAVESDAFLALLAQADSGDSGGWLQDNTPLEKVPAGRYLVDVLSGNDFQEQLKDYRDLGYLQTLLSEWLDNIDIYYDMVDARREAYRQRAPATRERLEKQPAQLLTMRWKELQSQFAEHSVSGDPLALVTGKEHQHWQKLQTLQKRLAALPDQPRHRNMLERAQWLQGILYWQIQSDYKTRSRNLEKELKTVAASAQEAGDTQQRVAQALEKAQSGFKGYDTRIDSLRQRILDLLPAMTRAREKTSTRIRHLAFRELEIREQRLVSYRNQARYALARSYDQMAEVSGDKP